MEAVERVEIIEVIAFWRGVVLIKLLMGVMLRIYWRVCVRTGLLASRTPHHFRDAIEAHMAPS